MGLFKKRGKKEEEKPGKLPELPQISELPELPEMKTPDSKQHLPQLPSYPPTTLGNKLSQNTIKEAVTGEKERGVEVDEFVRKQMMPKPHEIKLGTIKPKLPSKIEKVAPLRTSERVVRKTKQKGPVFIRIDKFEESLKIFEETQEKILNMEKLLSEIKELKEKEEKELSDWEAEIQTIKNQTERVERDIFSKIE